MAPAQALFTSSGSTMTAAATHKASRSVVYPESFAVEQALVKMLPLAPSNKKKKETTKKSIVDQTRHSAKPLAYAEETGVQTHGVVHQRRSVAPAPSYKPEPYHSAGCSLEHRGDFVFSLSDSNRDAHQWDGGDSATILMRAGASGSVDDGDSADGANIRVDCPSLTHSLKHDKSILALAVSSSCIFAGTEGGEILVFDHETCRKRATINAHGDSVLSLFLTKDEKQLFSSAADRFVNVWDTRSLQQLYSIYSTYDIGDIYCVCYSSSLKTVYLGAQNASIQWYDFKEKDSRTPNPTKHPHLREDRFFDSCGPGGVRTPRSDYFNQSPAVEKVSEDLEIDRQYILPFAHYGYVYAMLLLKGVVTDDAEEETLVSGGGDGSIKLWSLSVRDGGRIHHLLELTAGRENLAPVVSLALDGTFLISGRLEGEINVWDLETRQMVRTLKSNVGDVLALSVGEGFLFASGSKGSVQKFNSHYEPAGGFEAERGRILTSAFASFGKCPTYITGGNDNSINFWDIHDCISQQVANVTSNEKLVDKLRVFVSHKTVSSNPRYHAECRRGASFLRSVFREFGADTEVLLPGDPALNPIIFALFKGNPKTSGKLKRILFYGHYDVIPAENQQGKWIVDPFRMEGIDEYLYGRGTSDNKGPLMAAIYAVAELAAEKRLDSDILFLVEGEEECGSRGFEEAIRANKSLIGDVDWILLANSYWLDDYVPCLTYGLRGVIHATLEITSDHPDLHSGVDGSALLDESLKDLVLLLNSLVGSKGHVKLPHFYDPILPLTKSEARLYAEITSALLNRNPELGSQASQESLAKTLQQKWREATITLHHFDTSGPDQNSTIIPKRASVAISLRLVPNQEARCIADNLVRFLEAEFKKLGTSNRLKVTIDHKAEAWLGDFNNLMYKTLEEGIMRAWYGDETNEKESEAGGGPSSRPHSAGKPRRPLYIREGGSIPAIRFLETEFGAPAAHLPCGQASDNAHLDNERLRLVNLYKSKDVLKWVFKELPNRS